MQKLLLLGDEAIAMGAIDAGISGIYAYPGTPSTEITEFVHASKEAKEKGILATWGANEKTAMEEALGMSYAGKRTMVCMKHVGLNVAADPFMNSAITGANGGMIVVAADDPSMHSSQNEQDSRVYGKFALIPILEPSNQQEAYDMVHYGFEISEKYKVPVMIRVTTRLAHSRAGVVRRDGRKMNDLTLPSDARQFVLLPAIARKRYTGLLNNQAAFRNESATAGFNKLIDGADKTMGVIACGIAYNYLMENFPKGCPFPVLKIGQYPLPLNLVENLVDTTERIMILEDGYPLIEELISGLLHKGINVSGRHDERIPRQGELNPNIIARAFGMADTHGLPAPEMIVSRPPKLCDGCPHIDSYNALLEALQPYSKGRVFSDIGCYTLGALPPFEAINSAVDMGASITMAKGAADAGLIPSVAVIGDSTFTHSGMTGLLDAVNSKSPVTIVILDNATTGMTGGQDSAANGRLLQIVTGLGVEPEHIRILKPLRNRHEENVKIFKEELAYNGVSVIMPTRECVQTLNRRMREKFKNKDN